jgi:uncharacterized protein
MQIIMLKKDSLFVDTSGWACYFAEDKDEIHFTVAAFMKDKLQKEQHFVTTNYVIAELVALLSSRYHLSRDRVITKINEIKTNAKIEIVHSDQILDSKAWKLLEKRPDKEWSLVDASSFAVMETFKMAQAVTTDHHFAQAGFEQFPKSIRRFR